MGHPVLPLRGASVLVAGGAVGCSGEQCCAAGGYEGAQSMMDMPEPLGAESPLSHPRWWGPGGSADPLSSLPNSGMLKGASGVQKPSPRDRPCPLGSAGCQLQRRRWDVVPSGCVFARWDCSARPDPTARFSFLPSLCCRISSQHQHPGDPCHGETRGNSPKIERKKQKKNNKKVRKAAEGCPSTPEAVGLRGVVAAVTRQGAGSQVKHDPVAGSHCRVAGISHGNVSGILSVKGWRPAFSYPRERL